MHISALELSRQLQHRELSSLALMEDTLARIDRANGELNAIVSLAERDRLLEQAAQADRELDAGEVRGWLHGIPHAVKDLADCQGFITTRGSTLYRENLARDDSIMVARLRKAGAIFIGKTNVPEFGLGSQSYNRVFGTTRNAFDSQLAAGGSSGGAAVALATGMLPVADGSDMMGSLRNPAAFNAVIGFRPGLGRVPGRADEVFFSQLATAGPMGRTVRDVIQLFHTMAGFHPSAPLSHQPPLPDPESFTGLPGNEVKIGWLADYEGYLAMEPGVLSTCEGALQQLDAAGVKVEPVRMDFDMGALWTAWLNLRHWTVGNGYRTLFADPIRRAELKPEICWEWEQSQTLTATEVAQAAEVRSAWYQALRGLFERFDFLALPSAQVFPFAAECHWPDEINGVAMDTYHRWMEVVIGGSLAGGPSISLPAGEHGGRPMGLQLLAPLGQDTELLEFALSYETIHPWSGVYEKLFR